jgi:5-methylcytosine-specific restriction endonuclease McrA
VCGRVGQGDYCALHEPVVDEAARNARNPYRQAYKDQEYARNRQHRYERARGRCEDCGLPVGPGEWECDHVVPLSQGGTNGIEDLRIRCIVPRPGAERGCHGLKTAADRRSRRRA